MTPGTEERVPEAERKVLNGATEMERGGPAAWGFDETDLAARPSLITEPKSLPRQDAWRRLRALRALTHHPPPTVRQ